VKAIIRWGVPPKKSNIGMVNAGIEVFCHSIEYARRDILRLQACIEGVFCYCVGNIRSQRQRNELSVGLFSDAHKVEVVIQHCGPGGEWDFKLRSDSNKPLKRTGFDAMGLYIANEMLFSLEYESRFDIVTGNNNRIYTLLYLPQGR